MPSGLAAHRSILDFALSSLWRRRARALALLGVYTLVVFLLASLVFLVQALKREARLLLQGAPDLVVQRTLAGRHDLVPLDWAPRIAALRGVRAVVPRHWGYLYDPAFGANFTVVGADPGTLGPDGAALGTGAARVLRVASGDFITLRSSRGTPLLLTVERVFPAESELVAADLVLLAPERLKELFDLPADRATDLAVSVGNPRELDTIASKVVEAFPEARPILKREILRTYAAVLDWRGGLVTASGAMALLAFLILAWDRASGLSAEERREIGILRSVGWETSDVLALKAWEGAVVSLTAFLLGLLLAFVHVFHFSAPLFEGALKGWSVLYPKFRLVPELDPLPVAALFFLTVVPYTLATLIPSWRAATVDPDAALRS